jgi:uncharacterized iron-regulated membrane protein
MHDAVTEQEASGAAELARRWSALAVILFAHRYLAVALGALMTLWCLSGFVMMYQGYPALTDSERRAGLAPLDFTACCKAADLPFLDEARAPEIFRVEMLLGRPVLRIGGPGVTPNAGVFDLTTGERVPELTLADVRVVAAEFGGRHGLGAVRAVEPVEIDQWTLQTARRHRPVYRVELGDEGGTQVYVSGATGEVVQDTNRRERLLAWLGAIPHWLYPTQLRSNGPLWVQIVVWTSLLGTFLAITGLYVGISRLRRRNGRVGSPLRGWWYWHHVSGLVFGVFTLTWVFSGLMTMNPWGALAGTGAFDYVGSIKGGVAWRDVKEFLAAAPARLDDGRFVDIRSAIFDDRFHALAVDAQGERARLDGTALPAPLELREIDAAVRRLDLPVVEARLLETADSYYYGHKSEVDLPVYRVVLGDADRTRLYVDPVTGAARGVDATMRASRWIRFGLHDLDFAGLRVRPVWDIVVGSLLLGVTLTCAIGTWLALKRLRRDVLRIWRPLARRAPHARPEAARH